MKNDLSQSLATAEFSKFAEILSAALSQYHLLGFDETEKHTHTERDIHSERETHRETQTETL